MHSFRNQPLSKITLPQSTVWLLADNRLMVELLDIPIPDRHFSIYDPAGGTGGMLSVSKEHLLDRAATPEEKDRVEKFLTVHGQELSPTNYAVCQADLLIKNDRQAKVTYGNSLIPHDPHSKEPGDQWPEGKYSFNRMLSNPPFGVTWGGKDGYEAEARKLEKTRYRAGMPRVNDGALLFLQTMLAKMIPFGVPPSGGSGGPAKAGTPNEGSRIAGIFTYIWLLRNEKPASHRGRVMLVDARQQFEKEPKAFSYKRNRMTDAHRAWVEERYFNGWAKGYADEQVKIFRREDFAYHQVGVVFWQTDGNDQPAVITEPYEKAFSAANVTKEQEYHCREPRSNRGKNHSSSGGKDQSLLTSAATGIKFTARVKCGGKEKTIELALTAKDNAAKKFKAAFAGADEIVSVQWTHRHYVADDEYIPYGEDIEAFLKREIAKPIIRWEDSPQLGYEFLPNKYFYRYQPPTPAKDLLAEFWKLEKEAEEMLKGLAQ